MLTNGLPDLPGLRLARPALFNRRSPNPLPAQERLQEAAHLGGGDLLGSLDGLAAPHESGGAWFDRMREGVQKFGKDTGNDTLLLGPAKADAAEQVKSISPLWILSETRFRAWTPANHLSTSSSARKASWVMASPETAAPFSFRAPPLLLPGRLEVELPHVVLGDVRPRPGQEDLGALRILLDSSGTPSRRCPWPSVILPPLSRATAILLMTYPASAGSRELDCLVQLVLLDREIEQRQRGVLGHLVVGPLLDDVLGDLLDVGGLERSLGLRQLDSSNSLRYEASAIRAPCRPSTVSGVRRDRYSPITAAS